MHIVYYEQQIPISIDKCWEFFSSPNNLNKITPPHLGFLSSHKENEKMYAGQVLIHKLRPLRFLDTQTWVTEITQVQKPNYFIDEQRLGPFKFWHHEHRFKETKDGVLIIDRVHYKVPYGILGNLVNRLKIKKDIAHIFAYRKQKLTELFKTNS